MNPSLDNESHVEEVKADQKLRCSKGRAQAGGGGVNVARALKRIDIDATAIFPAGGHQGERYCDLLRQEKIDFQSIQVAEEMRINTHVMETSTGKQFRFCMPGFELSEKKWREVLALIKKIADSCDLFISSGSLPPGVPPSFNAELAAIMQDAGKPFIVDTKGEALKEALHHPVFFIKPNLREFQDLAGHKVDQENLEAELKHYREHGNVENILLTLGGEGAIYCGSKGIFRVEAPQVEKVSTVGAGDCSMAGLIAALTKGHSHEQAVRWAMAAGAAAVKTPGTDLMHREDFEAILREQK